MLRFIGFACAVLVLTPLAAHADVKVVQEVTIRNPQIAAMLQSMAPAQRTQIAKMGMAGMMTGAPTPTVTYFHSGEARIDAGTETLIANPARHTLTTLNHVSHTYTVSPFSLVTHAPSNVQVQATGQMKMVAGHLARRYLLKEADGRGGSASGDIWSAADLPQPPFSLISPSAAGLGSEFRKVKGMPLIVNLNMAGGPIGATTFHVVTRSISTRPLPSSLFSLPPGYHKVASQMGINGMPGGMTP